MKINTQKQRIIQEQVPGRQLTLAHIIANPDASLYESLLPKVPEVPEVPEEVAKKDPTKDPTKDLDPTNDLAKNPEKDPANDPTKNSTKGTAIGIINITPTDTAIIIADIAIKSSGAQILSADRVNGSLITVGTVAEVEAATSAILDYVNSKLGFEVCQITKT